MHGTWPAIGPVTVTKSGCSNHNALGSTRVVNTTSWHRMSVDALNLTVPIDPSGERFLLLEPASAGSDGGARQSLTFVLH